MVFRLFGLWFDRIFRVPGCPEPSSFGLFLFGRSSRSVFAKINPLQPPAARWPGLPFISNSSSIFGSLRVPKPPNSRTFSPRPEFFQISWKQSPVVAGITPSPTGVVLTTSTDSWVAAALSQLWSSCSTHLLRRVLLSYSFRDQRKNLPWNDATPPTSSPPLTP